MADVRFICDVCGAVHPERERVTLHDRYVVEGISEVCGPCHRDISAAWDRCNAVTKNLLTRLMHRAILALRAKADRSKHIEERALFCGLLRAPLTNTAATPTGAQRHEG